MKKLAIAALATIIASPSAIPIEPPINLKFCTAIIAGAPSIAPLATCIASGWPVRLR